MRTTFSVNPINRLLCDIENWKEKMITKHWRNGRHICRCHVCGYTLDSTKDKWSPEECGWMRLKDKHIYDPWICHSCLEHHSTFCVRKYIKNDAK